MGKCGVKWCSSTGDVVEGDLVGTINTYNTYKIYITRSSSEGDLKETLWWWCRVCVNGMIGLGVQKK